MPEVDAVEEPWQRRSRLGLAGLMLVAGAVHFLNPKFYDLLIPSWLPGSPRLWIYASGLAELGAGALTANRSTARIGAWATLIVLVGVFPANVWEAITNPPTDGRGVGPLVRLPFQIPLILWAYKHTKDN